MPPCPPTRWGSGRLTALLALVVTLVLLSAPGAAAQPPLVLVPSAAADGQVRLLVQVPDGAGGPLRPEAFSASVDGVPQPARAEPVLSDRLAMGLVVDASADGSPLLSPGLGGAANLVLAAPPAARSTLVTDSTPPTVAVPWPSGPADTVGGLSAVRSGGARSTAAALDLALAQLQPAAATDPRLVLLYTGAPDAGVEPAPAIIERMRAAGVLLAVVDTSGGTPAGRAASPFWTSVAAGTGGIAVGAEPAGIIGAFDEVLSALGRRHLLTFPAPDRAPATAVVRVDTGSGPLIGEVAVASAVPAPVGSGGPSPLVAVGIGVALAVILAAGAVALLRRRTRHVAGSPRVPEQRSRSVPGQQIWDIPIRPEAAVDREALLAELAATLHVGRPVWLRPRADVAGVGTTSVMIEYALRHRARYDVVWWIPAADPDLVPDRMAQLAEAMGLAGSTDSADRATAALLEALSRRHRWLLIFDDAAGPRELARYLPDGTGDVLIASKESGWREQASPLTVPEFSRAESVSLLRSRRADVTGEQADLLAATLDDLPLAVGPAAGLLADTGMEVDTVRALLADRPSPTPDNTPDTATPDASDAVAGVWAITLNQLAADDPLALALLTLAAWLGPAPLPLSLVIEHPQPLPEPLRTAARRASGLVESAAVLRRRGLALVSADEVSLHPVPAALLVARSRHDHAEDGGWTAMAVRLLRAAVPDRPAAEPGSRPVWRRLLPHVLAATDPTRRLDVVANDVGWLLAQAGGYLAARGRSTAARALLEDANEFDVGARLRAFGES